MNSFIQELKYTACAHVNLLNSEVTLEPRPNYFSSTCLAAGYLMVKLPSEILSFCLRYASSSVGQHISSWSKIRDSSNCSRIMTKSNWVSSSLLLQRVYEFFRTKINFSQPYEVLHLLNIVHVSTIQTQVQ